MKTSRVLVTGIKGFIGKHLGGRLKESGTTLVGETNKQGLALDVTDMNELSSMKKEEIDIIVHLAAKTSVVNSFERPYDTYCTNILGTLNLLELARKKNISRFIFVSTYVYGQPTYLPVDERHPTNPHSPYHRSKLIAEKLCKNYSDDYGMNVVILRPFYIYGPDARSSQFIQSILMQIRKNGRVKLSGEQTKRDFLFVDDFVDLIETISDKFPHGCNLYNVGYGRSYTLNEVAYSLAKLLNIEISIDYDATMRPNDVSDMVADISKVADEFGWRPSTDLEAGLGLCTQDRV